MNHNKAFTILSFFFIAGLVTRFVFLPALFPKELPLAVKEIPPNPFDQLSFDASAVYVYDIETGEELYARGEGDQLPLASLTKLMTVIVAEEELGPESRLAISKRSVAVSGDSGLLVGEEWSLRNLAMLTLVGSLNDGAAALAEAVKGEETFVDRMNKKARELGLEKTYFLNESGLDESGATAGAYGSAKDVARILAYAAEAHPDVFAGTRYGEVAAASESSRVLSVSNTNDLVVSLPGTILSKTGTTPLAGGNLGVVFDAGLDRPVAAVILGDDPLRRFDDMERLVSATREFFATKIYE